MSKNVKLVLADGQKLDIATDFGLGVTYSIEDVKDPSKRNSSFSKTIVLPGTKGNNKILGYLFDINTDFTYFNPNFKLDCKILVDDTVILDGFLQLRKINKEDGGNTIYYETVVYEDAVDFFSLMGENFLTDLDFTELDHIYNATSISNSWTNTYSDGYVYPVYYKNSVLYNTQDFTPAIFLRYYLEKIAATNGFTLGGSFLDDEIFTKEIIPYNGGQPELTDGSTETREFEAYANADNQISVSIRSSDWASYTPEITDLTELQTETDPNNIWTIATNKWTNNTIGKYDMPIQLGFHLNISAATGTWMRVDSTGSGDGPLPIWVEVIAFKNGTQIGSAIKSGDSILPYNPIDTSTAEKHAAFSTYNGTSHDLYFNVTGNLFTDELLTIGDEITYKVALVTADTIIYANDAQAISGNPPQGRYADTPATVGIGLTFNLKQNLTNGNLSKLWNKPGKGYLADQDTAVMNSFIPLKIKQKDLFSDLIKRYNLMITTDNVNHKKILLETRNDFYNSNTTTLDWTDKKDYSYNDQIELLSELQNKKIDFTYKKGKDEWSNKYETITSNIYGEKEIEYANEFVKGTKKIESIFSSTPLVYNSINNQMVVPYINTVQPKSGIKILQYNGLISTINSTQWFFEWIDTAGNTSLSSFTTYPYAGHWDNPYAPTIDNHFSSIVNLTNGDTKALEWYDELANTTNNNLYNRYWSSYINQIDDGKLVTMRLALSENDINSVKDNFATTIFIDDAYYLINEIQDYDPTKDSGLTIVKLLKVKKLITFNPTTTDYSGTTGTVQVEETGVERPAGNTNEGGQLLTASDADSNIQSQHVSVVGEDNIVYENVSNISVVGEDNIIENSVKNSGILGSTGSKIGVGAENSWIIGVNNKTITRSNEVWLGNLHIIDGVVVSQWNLIEGGYNSLGWPRRFAINSFNTIEGGDEELRDINYTSIQNLIDGGFESI